MSIPIIPNSVAPDSPLCIRPGHPSGLWVLAAAEAAERFGFYLMLALLVLCLNERHQFSEARASTWYGNYLGACYALPLLGGWLAGRIASRGVWVRVGAVVLAFGYFLLALERTDLLWVALAVLSLGNGLFKPNISAQIGSLYPAEDSRRDEAFGLFYLAINLGGLAGPLVGEQLRRTLGWGAAFGAASVALGISAVILHAGRRHLGMYTAVDSEPSSGSSRRRVAALLLICVAAQPFWAAFHLYGSALTLWARDSVDRTMVLWGSERQIPPGWFAASNSGFVLLLSAPLAWLLRRFSVSSAAKLVWGLLLSAAAFGVLFAEAHLHAPSLAAPGGLLTYYFIISVAELMLSPVGLSLVSRLSPPRWVGLMFGVWFTSTAVGNWLSGPLGRLYTTWPHDRFFGAVGLLLLAPALLLATQLGWLRCTLPTEEK